MRTKLTGKYVLTKTAHQKVKNDIKDFFATEKKRLDQKGIVLVKISFLKNILSIVLSTKKEVKPYTELLYFRNKLAAVLGKKHKVGVKDIYCDDLIIEKELSRNPLEEVKLPFTKKVDFIGRTATVEFDRLDQTALSNNYVDKILKLLDGKIAAQHVTGKAATERTVRASKKRLNKYILQEDPTQELIDRGWVKEFPGAGVWIVMPPFAALMRAMYQLVVDKIIKPLGFSEILLPRLIPLDVARRKGTLGGIPYEMFWVCPPAKRDPKYFEEFGDHVKITDTNSPEKLKQLLGNPMFGLSHGQCEPFYQIFFKELVDVKKLPIKAYDLNGPTWRWEGGGIKGLERLNEFLRVEFVYAGTKKQTIKIRDDVLKKSEEIMNKIFDVQYRIDANIPVYLEHAGQVDSQKEADFVKSYDMVAILPFQTASKPEAELEISSYHVHTDYYMKQFYAKEKTGKDLWTGCVGIGPSRWAFTFLLRWGFDYKKWPKEIKKYIGKELPKNFDFVTWPKKKNDMV